VRRPLALWIVLISAALGEQRASAQNSQREELGSQIRVDGGALWRREMPTTRLPEGVAGGRVGKGELPTTGSSWMVAVGGSFDLVWKDRYLFPLLATELAWSVGRRPVVYGAVDGSIVEMHPWKAWQANILLPGVGRRWKRRRWSFAAAVQPGFSATVQDIDVADGSSREERPSVGVHLLVRAWVEGCRRLDPERRVCLFVAPDVVNQSLFNGGAAGLRWEFGP
jgi:hypothetical protein